LDRNLNEHPEYEQISLLLSTKNFLFFSFSLKAYLNDLEAKHVGELEEKRIEIEMKHKKVVSTEKLKKMQIYLMIFELYQTILEIEGS
jgi:hypothetical protein